MELRLSLEWVIGLVLPLVISVAINVLFYIKSQRYRQPVWGIESNNLVSGSQIQMDHLEIRYRARPVENLTVSKIWFWNQGQEVISREQLVENNPLRIEANGDTWILDVSILAKNASAFAYHRDAEAAEQQAVYFDIDFLRHNQGALLQVIHSGTSSEDIDVRGEIRDRVVKKVAIPSFAWSFSPIYIVIYTIFGAAWVALVSLDLLEKRGITSMSVGVTLIFVFALIGGFVIFQRAGRIPPKFGEGNAELLSGD